MYRYLTIQGPYRRYPRWEDRADRVIWMVGIGAIASVVMGWL
jgi:hypothetical protein